MDSLARGLGVHPLWLLIGLTIFIIVAVAKAREIWRRKWIYNEKRVREHEQTRKKIWLQKQKELDPNIEDEEPEPAQAKSNLPPPPQSGPKKRFNKIFGYDNIGPSKTNCSMGG
jgi:hypothetical protein